MRKIVCYVLVVCATILPGWLFSPIPYVSAQSDESESSVAWEIKTFDSHIAFDDNLSGGATISEDIRVRFDTPRHGIYRDIPERYNYEHLNPFNRINLRIRILSVQNGAGRDWQYTQERQSGYLRLVIGDPDVTVTSDQRYVIRYHVDNLIQFLSEGDELYLNINGDMWDSTIGQVSATLSFPDSVETAEMTSECFTGWTGSLESACTIRALDDHSLLVSTDRPLSSYQTLSVGLSFDKGVFTQPSFMQRYLGTILSLAFAVCLPIMTFYGTWRYWYKYGKDPKSRRAVVPWYEPIKGLSPVEAGKLVDFSVDNRDITASIVDLAIKGYLIIQQSEKKRWFAKSKKYSLVSTGKDLSGLQSFEKTILEGLFDKKYISKATVELEDLASKYHQTISQAREEVNEALFTKKLLSRKSKSAGSRLTIVAVIMGIATFIMFNLIDQIPGIAAHWWIPCSLGLSALIMIPFIRFMSKRTKAGAETLNHLQGLKMYMEVAEKDRLDALQGPESSMQNGSADIGQVPLPTPVKTAKLYESLLPFAIALGVEKQWSEKFEDIYQGKNPSWYQGYVGSFHPLLLASSLGSFSSSIAHISSPPRAAGGGGFGGGAGGGFGGGGGGSW